MHAKYGHTCAINWKCKICSAATYIFGEKESVKGLKKKFKRILKNLNKVDCVIKRL